MTTETDSPLSPAEALAAARAFFLGADRMADAWIDTESDSHIAFCTFRGNLAVAAFPDPDDPEATRVRVTTLREEGIVPRLLTHLALAGTATAGPKAAAGDVAGAGTDAAGGSAVPVGSNAAGETAAAGERGRSASDAAATGSGA